MIFLNSASSAAALVFYLPGVCTHSDTEGKGVRNILKSSGKKTIFNEHPVESKQAICYNGEEDRCTARWTDNYSSYIHLLNMSHSARDRCENLSSPFGRYNWSRTQQLIDKDQVVNWQSLCKYLFEKWFKDFPFYLLQWRKPFRCGRISKTTSSLTAFLAPTAP